MSNEEIERLLKKLKRFDAKRVFLAMDTYEEDEKKRRRAIKELAAFEVKNIS